MAQIAINLPTYLYYYWLLCLGFEFWKCVSILWLVGYVLTHYDADNAEDADNANDIKKKHSQKAKQQQGCNL